MRSQFRRLLRTGGSVLVLFVIIVLVSTDTKTVVALSMFCAVGYGLLRFVRGSAYARPIRTRVTPARRRAIGITVVVVAIAAAADEPDAGLWMIAMAVTGYTGYRSGRVFRGAITGAIVGVVGAILLATLAGTLFLVVTMFDIGGGRQLLYQVLFAPPVLGFLTLVWLGFALALGGGTGLVCGGLGGAVARLL